MEDTSEKVHRLADTTYRNNEELSAELQRLTAAAKAYHKAMQGLAQASGHFYSVLSSIGNKAANLPGSVRRLGDAMEDLVTGYEQTSKQYKGLMHSLNTDFIVPLETKLEAEEKSLTGMHKTYKQENGKKEALVIKTGDQIRSMKKKKQLTTSQQEKIAQLTQILSDQQEELHMTRVEGLRKALLEERKLFCFVLDHLCSVIHNEIAYNASSHKALSTRVNDLRALSSSPTQLPEESAALLIDPQSPRAFPPHGGENTTDGALDQASTPGSLTSPKARTRRVSCRVKALYPHQASESSQLNFTPGDLIDALDAPQDGWQYGENTRTGSTGWFPAQYVKQVCPTPPVQQKSSVVSMSPLTNSQQPDQPISPPLPDKDY